jgi:ABC-2 type transport system permease protein
MMLLSVLGQTEQAVGGSASAIMVVMAMFGGGMIPLIAMPDWMQTASNISPVKWGILALEGAIWRGFSASEMLLPCGILLAVGAISFALGVRILARRDF